MTRYNLLVLAMLTGLGVHLYEADQPSGYTLGGYMVALWGSRAEKQAMMEDLAREQAETLHMNPFCLARRHSRPIAQGKGMSDAVAAMSP